MTPPACPKTIFLSAWMPIELPEKGVTGRNVVSTVLPSLFSLAIFACWVPPTIPNPPAIKILPESSRFKSYMTDP